MPLRQEDLDGLWDFDDAASSETRLRAAAAAETDAGRRAELLTQVARALGLQDRFDEADALLDSIEPLAIEPLEATARTRVALERGRILRSRGDPEAAVPSFRTAVTLAEAGASDFLLVDALHMLALADGPNADAWTSRASAVLDRVGDPRTQRWRVSLHNNLGWARFDAGDLEAALVEFRAALDAAERWGTPQQVRWAHDAIEECSAARARR